MSDLLTLEPAELVEMERADDGDGRTLTVRLLSWDEPARTAQGVELFARGAFDDVDPAQVVLESQRHGGELVGRGVAVVDAADGPYMRFRVSRTQAGDDLLTLIRDQVVHRVSAVFRPLVSRSRPDGAIERVKAELKRVAILQDGAYGSAQVVEVRGADMSDEMTTTPQPETVDLAPIMSRLDAQAEVLAQLQQERAQAATEQRGAFDDLVNLADVWHVIATEPDRADELNRALADNTFAGQGTGLTGSANIAKIIEPVLAKRRTINAVGLAGLPEVGMTLDYIEFDRALSTGYEKLVQEQASEKDEIGTGTHSWVPKQTAIKTYAGGSDNSWQLLERSSPSFRELLLRQYASEWAFASNAAMVADLVAKGTPDSFTLMNNVSDVVLKLIEQSVAIEAEVDLPADVVLCATDVWTAFARLPDMINPEYQVMNGQGTINAGVLDMRISGLALQHEKQLPDGKMITTRSGGEAAEWHEDGPRLATQEQVAKLGTDVAVWGLAAPTVYRLGAVIVTTVTLS